MSTILEVYNRALDLIGEPRLVSVSQRRLARHALDDAYTYTLAECLRSGVWEFALRTAALVSTTLPTPAHGFKYAYTVPADKVLTYIMFDNATAQKDLDDYAELNGKYLTNLTPMYVRYTSNDASFGGSLLRWTELYADYVAISLAKKVCFTLTRNADLWKALSDMQLVALNNARLVDGLMSSAGIKAHNALHRREFNKGANVLDPWPFPVGAGQQA